MNSIDSITNSLPSKSKEYLHFQNSDEDDDPYEDIEEINHPIKTEPITIVQDVPSITEQEDSYSASGSMVVAEHTIETGSYNDDYSDYNYETSYAENSISAAGVSLNNDGNKGKYPFNH